MCKIGYKEPVYYLYRIQRKEVNRKGRRRITIDLPEYYYLKVKSIAKNRNITLTRLLIRLIARNLKEEID